jgi:hypothetical protein
MNTLSAMLKLASYEITDRISALINFPNIPHTAPSRASLYVALAFYQLWEIRAIVKVTSGELLIKQASRKNY